MPKTRLISKGGGLWETEDGRAMVSLDSTFETECDEPHPVRLSLAALDSFSPWYRKTLLDRGKMRGKYLTYQCEGNETHFYSMWTVQIDGEWTDDVYETFAVARTVLEEEIGPVTLVRRKTTRPVVTDPATGRARWETCGHPAELDINERCYVCHESVEVTS